MSELEKPKAAVAISGEVHDKVEKWAKQYKVDFGYAMSLYMKYIQEYKTENKALMCVQGDLEFESGRPSYYTYVMIDSGPVDIFELMRKKVTRLYDNPETRDDTIQKGMVTEDGMVLDYREKVFGKPNENKGMPLEGHLWNRSILAIIGNNDAFDGASLVEITSSNEPAKNTPIIEGHTVYKAFINQNKNNPLRYSFGKLSKFNKIPSTVTTEEIANKITDVPLNELEEEYNRNFAGKRVTNYLVPIRGFVSWINLESSRGSRSFMLHDPDTEITVRCRMYENIPVKFQRTDELLAFVKLYAGRDGKIGTDVKAYMVI